MRNLARTIGRGTLGAMALALASCSVAPLAATGQSGDYDEPRSGEPEFWGDHDLEAEGSGFGLELFVGAREMQDDAWSPLDDQLDLGFAVQVPLLGQRSEQRLDLADHLDWDFGLRYSFDDARIPGAAMGDPSREVDTESWDATIGLLYAFGNERTWLRPYIGGGAALLYADVEFLEGTAIAREKSTIVTGYARGGARFRFRPGQYFGVDVRWLADTGNDVDGLDASAESLTVSFVFGASY